MRILLISPNTLTVPYPVYPLGLDYVAGAIAAEHEVRIADMNVVTLDGLAAMLKDFSPEIIGLSCRNIDNTDAGDPLFFISALQQLVAWLKARSSVLLICGGSGFSIMPEQVFAALGVDYGIIGEGERFALLVDALKNGQKPATIPGVITPAFSAGRPLPWQGEVVRKFQHDASHNQFYLQKGGILNLQSKRGCSFNCIYCPYPQIEGKKHRLVEPSEVARTALALQEAGAKYFFITDSAFNSDIEHSLAVARAFQAAGVSIPWGAFFAPTKLPADYFTIMAASGCVHVEFGTESLSDDMLRSYRKPFRRREVFAAHRQARAAGLHIAHYLLLGGPGESAATITKCLNSVEQLDKTVIFFFIGIRIYPGTTLHDIARAEGQIVHDTNMLHPVFYEPDAIDRQTIETMVKQKAGGRINWILGSGGAKIATTVNKMHDRGYTGPLWEYLVR